MEYSIECRPSYSLVEIHLEPQESFVAESGAMTWRSPTIEMETSTRGGILTGLKRKVLAGESFFQNRFTAEHGAGTVGLAAGAAGDVVPLQLDDQELFLEKGAYLASTDGVSCDAKWDGLRGLFNEGMFVLKCSGTGLLFFQAYGEIQQIDVDGEHVVDNGYAVAWEPSLEYRITRARKIRSFLFSDQLLLRFSGKGKLWVQTRSARALASFAHPFRSVQSSNSNS